MVEWINTADDWKRALDVVGGFDFYHTYEYHQLSRLEHEDPWLVRIEHEGSVLLLPLLLRSIADAPDVESKKNATSVYGYPGPLCRLSAPGACATLWKSLEQALVAAGVVDVFSRLHPLSDGGCQEPQVGEVRVAGATVSIDISASEAEQLGGYRKTTRHELKQLRQQGQTCEQLSWAEYGSTFVDLYRATMRRRNAQQGYWFSDEYFNRFVAMSGVEVVLFGCPSGGALQCAALFTHCNGIVQYHLSGSVSVSGSVSPVKLMIDTARQWAVSKGAHTLHLGGGVGGRQDALFAFKAGFSKSRCEFKVWRWIVDPAAYARLCDRAGVSVDSTFFPAYRAPSLMST